MYAVISDVHANREALQAVLETLKGLRPERIVCLGDMVGYGPDPAWCVDTVLAECEVVLAGNHDAAVTSGRFGFTQMAGAAIRYHRLLLNPLSELPGDSGKRKKRWERLRLLGHRQAEGGCLFVHGSPRNPVNEYLRESDVTLGTGKKVRENFTLVEWLAFVGHTHKPGVITSDMEFLSPDDCGGLYRAMPGRKAIVNVGSVGHPRDGDPSACFVTVDGPEIRYHRVPYDVEATVAKIHESGGLDPRFADRLRSAT